MRSNRIHYGYKGASTVEYIDSVEFRFDNRDRVQCGSWFHIVVAIRASANVVDEILSAAPIESLVRIPDEYASQRAADAI
jgi:hypothetical protein